jgi:hypothetical protein
MINMLSAEALKPLGQKKGFFYQFGEILPLVIFVERRFIRGKGVPPPPGSDTGNNRLLLFPNLYA